MVVREALKKLREERVILTYHGSGSFVANPKNFLNFYNENPEISFKEFSDIMQFRSCIEFSAIKKYALANNIPLFQFPKISRDGVIDIKALEPDLMVTAAYGQILSQEVLSIPKFGIINVHS